MDFRILGQPGGCSRETIGPSAVFSSHSTSLPNRAPALNMPKPTYSAHWIAHSGLRRAVANFVDEERAGIEYDMKRLAEESPFRKDGEG